MPFSLNFLRIIKPYKANVQHWENGKSNWTAVTTGSVANSIMYLAAEEEFYELLPRFLRSMNTYLSGFEEDGVCQEGYNYWWYGFGYFLQFSSLLKQYTNGEYDLLKGQKLQNIAEFQQKVLMGKNMRISFSDADSTSFKHDIGYTHFIYRNFENIEIPSNEDIMFMDDDHCYRWGAFIRRFLWTDLSFTDNTISKKSCLLKDAQWYIKNTENYSFAAKGGHNNEPHNHNDLGSFILNVNNKHLLTDIGAEEYVLDYFSAERYTKFLATSSRGHSLPIIDGSYQLQGTEHKGVIEVATDNNFELSFEKAYGIDYLKSIRRRFEFDENSIILKDTYSFDKKPESITERFITLEKPELRGNQVTVQNIKIIFNPNELECILSDEVYSNHQGNPTTANIIDFKVLNLAAHIECEFKIEILNLQKQCFNNCY